MLEAKNLSKTYNFKEGKGLINSRKRKEVLAVRDISINVSPGQMVGLLGINGAGKTTTIKMLSTLIEPTSGSIMIDDVDGIKYSHEAKKIINVISGGERNIYWRLTAKENLEYFGALYNIPNSVLRNRIEELLNLVGLADVADRPVERYSKGMKQRLQIARGLINDPKYLFLDEPTLGLDIEIAKELREYFRTITKKYDKGILLTSHYINEIEELCDWVYVIDKGEVIASGTAKEIIQAAKVNVEVVITVSYLPSEIAQIVCSVGDSYNATVKFENNELGTVIRASAKENLTTKLLHIFISKDLPVIEFKTVEPRLEDALMELSARSDRSE